MSESGRPWLVTRPAAAGQALTQALAARGLDAHWWPAFDIGPAPDEATARAALDTLAHHDLAILVSPAAVRATAALLGDRGWPSRTWIGAVGSGTRQAVEVGLHARDGAALTVISPPDAAGAPGLGDGGEGGDAATGSEAFWAALQAFRAAHPRPLRRALLLRAAQGRDWLRERLEAAGVQAQVVAVYSRQARSFDAGDRDWLDARRRGRPPVLVVTSSEAVDALFNAAEAMAPAVAAWLRSARALALHPRIVDRLRKAGVADAVCVAPEVEALIAAV